MKIYNANCLEIMQTLDTESIDLIVTSPPYDNLRNYNGSCEWNFEVFKKIANELQRILKRGGVIVWVVNDATIKGSETGTSFKQALYFKEIGLNIHDTMIWNKPHVFNFGSNNCYRQSFEYMFVFSKGTPKSINFIRDIDCKSGGQVVKEMHKNKDGKIEHGGYLVTINEKRKRTNVWNIPVANKNFGHPAVFPLQIAEDHIKSWSNENDTILDPFMGSGTTGVACKNLNRKFIGIELDKEYFNIAQNRLNTLI